MEWQLQVADRIAGVPEFEQRGDHHPIHATVDPHRVDRQLAGHISDNFTPAISILQPGHNRCPVHPVIQQLVRIAQRAGHQPGGDRCIVLLFQQVYATKPAHSRYCDA
ncbi:hypothetical protein D3C76_562730 [compost metagenome]